uniref:Cellulose-binding protein A n=1 Tax=Clostridium cellulovorans TaxID=1493 RepID=CBPA_CLOCL|nr:RecName: Full=Cellulose-binding protein A; Flags: Precursor [Clostridium cellulovorans]AAA23218.1 cellulose binding protein [Clostridium cellulovorans]
MQKKKSLNLLLALMMVFALVLPSIPALAATSSMSVEFYNSNKSAQTNSITPIIKITNTSDSDLNLNDVKVRYYYTSDGTQGQTFWCDHAGALLGNSYVDNTSKVTANFVKETASPTSTYDTYVEFGFASGRATLKKGQFITIQGRITKSDWSNYTQTNDYSFDASSSTPVVNPKVTGYIGGAKVLGTAPGPDVPSSIINPTSATFDKNVTKQADVKTTMTLNGNTFKTITDANGTALNASTDYSVSGNDVTISKAYLAKQSVGTTTLNFNFSAGNPQKLVITVVDTPVEAVTATIGKVQVNAGETVAVPVNLTKVPAAGLATIELPLTFDSASLEVVSITAGDIVLNPSVNFSSTVSGSTIKLLFLDDTLGSQLITKDGVFATITFKAKAITGTTAKVTSVKLAGTPVVGDAQLQEKPCAVNPGTVTINPIDNRMQISVGTATVKAGEIAAVPVTLTSVPSTGIATAEAQVSFDATLLEVASVTAGDIVLNPTVNFSYTVNGNVIKLLFLDDTLGSQLISKDGVFVTINFKAKAVTSTVTTPVTVSGTPVFADGTLAEVQSKTAAGSVTINIGDPILEPTISPVTATFDKKAPADVATTMTLNGYTFNGITGLTTSDYSISGNVVKISQAYLAKQPVGDLTLTFNFSNGNKTATAKLVVSIKDAPKTVTATVGTATVNAGETVAVPVTLSNVSGISTAELQLSFDATLLEVVSITAGDIVLNPSVNFSSVVNGSTIKLLFLDDTLGSQLISKDGVFATINFKAKSVTSTVTTPVKVSGTPVFADGTLAELSYETVAGSVTINAIGPVKTVTATVGTATVKSGETVAVPVTLSNVPGIATAELQLSFDATLLEVASITVGDIVLNPSVNFSSVVNGSTIKLLFLDDTLGSQLISKDGVLATINFKAKTVTSTVTTPVAVSGTPVFADGTLAELQSKTVAGSVTIEPSQPVKTVTATVGTATVKSGETVAVPVTLSNVPGIATAELQVGFDATLLEVASITVGDIVLNPSVNFSSVVNGSTIKLLFLDDTLGSQLISKDGVLATINFKAKTVTSKVTTPVAVSGTPVFADGTLAELNMKTVAGSVTIEPSQPVKTVTATVGTATVKSGETVAVPVTLSNVPGIATAELQVGFDATLLEVASITVGDIVLNPSVNFSSVVNGSTIKLLFLDDTLGSQLISKDGVLATINFKAKTVTSKVTTPVAVSGTPVFADGTLAELKYETVAGSVTIEPSQPVKTVTATVGTATGKVGETVAVPVTLSNVPGIATAEVQVGFDATLLEVASITAGDIVLNPSVNFSSVVNGSTIKILFLDDTLGSQLISKDGVFATINFKIKAVPSTGTTPVAISGTPVFADGTLAEVQYKTVAGSVTIAAADIKAVKATVGTATGKAGDTVAVPVTLSNVSGIATVELQLSFDATLLEVASITAGDIVLNPSVNFSSVVNGSTIKILFLDDTLGSQLISKDGVFATVNFKVKSTATNSAVTPVTVSGTPVFADGTLAELKSESAAGRLTILPTVIIVDSTVAPTAVTFDKANQADAAITMTLNGNTFSAIKNGTATLVKGTDYTVSENVVTISKAYLAKQTGTVTLEFVFDKGNSAKVVVAVKEIQIVNSTITPVVATFEKTAAKQADVVVTMSLNGNTFSAIKNGTTTLVKGTDYTISGSTVTISKAYLATLADGSATLEFVFNQGASAKLRLTIVPAVVDPVVTDFAVKIDKVSAAAGSTVKVPVSLINVSKVGNVCVAEYKISFDSSVLTYVGTTAGTSIKNPAVNFSSQLNGNTITLLFFDNTIGNELITADGQFATIEFKVNAAATSGTTAEVKVATISSFADASLTEITKVATVNGSVKVS